LRWRPPSNGRYRFAAQYRDQPFHWYDAKVSNVIEVTDVGEGLVVFARDDPGICARDIAEPDGDPVPNPMFLAGYPDGEVRRRRVCAYMVNPDAALTYDLTLATGPETVDVVSDWDGSFGPDVNALNLPLGLHTLRLYRHGAERNPNNVLREVPVTVTIYGYIHVIIGHDKSVEAFARKYPKVSGRRPGEDNNRVAFVACHLTGVVVPTWRRIYPPNQGPWEMEQYHYWSDYLFALPAHEEAYIERRAQQDFESRRGRLRLQQYLLQTARSGNPVTPQEASTTIHNRYRSEWETHVTNHSILVDEARPRFLESYLTTRAVLLETCERVRVQVYLADDVGNAYLARSYKRESITGIGLEEGLVPRDDDRSALMEFAAPQ
jgi:hypothetical protein